MNPSFEKPPGLTPEYAEQFQDSAIVSAYKFREPYSPETFETLRRVAGVKSPLVADLGCGPGDLSVGLASFAKRVDAVDISSAMLAQAKHNFSGSENIRWILSPAETAPLTGPYDLITAADSVHWMEWKELFASVKKWLKPDGFFAVVGRTYTNKEWWDSSFQALIDQYSTNRDFKKYDIIDELEASGLVEVAGESWTDAISFNQSPAELIEAFHSRNGFSRDRMGAEAAAEFDAKAAVHLHQFSKGGVLELHAISRVTWFTLA